jgi:hypothetical protein
MGTPQQQVERLRDLEDHGCDYVVLGPTTDSLEQLELLLELVIKPATEGRGTRSGVARVGRGRLAPTNRPTVERRS